jgi:(1->4)-alpha-D-glucan 1-alpha-D-glucosylmutase
MNRPVAPSATYRLQVTAGFSLFEAAAVCDYLAGLGVGAVYVSPLLRSRNGSAHGYDVVDHRLVDPARGGDEGMSALARACREAGLGLVVDIVPNHMGVAAPSQNHAWWDVLRLGQQSPYARWFDIDWRINEGRILIPVLGDDADPAADLTVVADELHYYEHRYPLAPGSGEGSTSEVHDRQHYQLVSFRFADTTQNYRRFFAETELASLRVEDPTVFETTHSEILRWVSDYGVRGLRIDHPDGLADPGGYLDRLAAAAPECWITVEKITEPGEQLPGTWPVAGTTGYDALSEVNALMVDPGAAQAMTRLYVELTGDERSFDQQAEDGKRMVATTILEAEVRRLARLAPELGDADPDESAGTDSPGESADTVAALTELTIAFPVYRSYLPQGAEHLAEAVRLATAREPRLTSAIEALLPRLSDPADELCIRFQQLTGAIMAKGVEDTAYYRYTRAIGLNEVGGYPGSFGSGIADFHAAQQLRARLRPAGMTALSTHDTKRGEDLRARLAVLAELGDQWGDTARELMRLAPVPNAAFGYLLWQTAVALPAIDPATRDRFHAYAEKAMREAADGTGWVDQNVQYEAAVHQSVDAAYDNPTVREMVASLSARIEPFGWSNALSQKVIQLTMPGVPDVYQGSELWDDSLVDPDNRRPVDFALREAVLAELSTRGTPPPVDGTGAAKLWVVSRCLQARRDHQGLFTSYTPLPADGPVGSHLVAFDRGGAITLATRLPVALSAAGGWGGATLSLPPGRYRDVFTGSPVSGEISLAQVFSRYPVALLLAEEPSCPR